MLLDKNSIVVANALVSLTEIYTLSGDKNFKLRTKTLKNVLTALAEANEWGQVYILDSLSIIIPKNAEHAEHIIESVLPRLNHNNNSVQMSAVKVVLKFLDYIENPDKVRTYCKDLATSLTTLMKSHAEIQYVLLRSLHAVVQKRPYLLDRDFKSFYVQHNDPVYVKLEKIEILYKLVDGKNFESILTEFKSYAIMEFDADIVKKVIKYIGCICFKYEKSLEVCVELMKEVLEHNQENTLSGGTLVMRDILRKYRGVSLELLKKVDQDYINALQEEDNDAKAAIIFIIGEFCNEINNNCVELIRPFVENFNNEANSVKLQTLNSVIKIYVKLPDEKGVEELIQECLRKGGEETENPDVRDRAYIYWRILETEPNLAREMMLHKRPAFEFKEDKELELEMVDNIIENMTNVSSVYHKINKELIHKEDMVVDEAIQNSLEEEQNNEENHNNLRNIEAENNRNYNDNLGMGSDNTSTGSKEEQNTKIKNNDIFNLFGDTSNNKNQGLNSEFEFADSSIANINPKTIVLFNEDKGITVFPPHEVYESSNLQIVGAFHRENSQILLGLSILNKSNSVVQNLKLNINKNSFGLNLTNNNHLNISIPKGSSEKVIFYLNIDPNNRNGSAPSQKYKLEAILSNSVEECLLSIPLNINILFTEEGKLENTSFVSFFKANNENHFNYSYTLTNVSVDTEEALKRKFEKNNIFMVAKQSKANPPLIYYSFNVAGVFYVVLECSFLKQAQSAIKIRILPTVENIIPLVQETVDALLA